jgi:hypothetical protein
MLFALCVIAFAMVFGGGAMRFGGILVMFGCLIVFVFGHWISPFVDGTKVKLQRSALVPTDQLRLELGPQHISARAISLADRPQ